jgi:hypothetical protein
MNIVSVRIPFSQHFTWKEYLETKAWQNKSSWQDKEKYYSAWLSLNSLFNKLTKDGAVIVEKVGDHSAGKFTVELICYYDC